MSERVVTGAAQLKANIKKMTAEMQTKTLASATRKGAVVVRDETERLAPIGKDGFSYYGRTKRPHMAGKLKANIKATKVRSKLKYSVSYAVAPKKKAYYWWFIENGTAKMTASPFLRPAFEIKQSEAAEAVINHFNLTIKKWNRKS